MFTPGKVHVVTVMGFEDERVEELKNILWDSGVVSDANTEVTIEDILIWERKWRGTEGDKMTILGTEERAKELKVILRRHSVAEGVQAELFIDDILDWHGHRVLDLGDRIDEMEQAMKWFCRRAAYGTVGSRLTHAVFKMLLADNNENREAWETRVGAIVDDRRDKGAQRLDWDWEIGEDEL